MPAVLVNFLAQLLAPVIKQVLASIGLWIDEKQIANKEQATEDAVQKLKAAKTLDEKKAAIEAISNAVSK